MYLRLFIETENFEFAKNILSTVLNPIDKKVKKLDIVKLEQYWKMEELILLEAEIELHCDLSEHDRGLLIYNIADRVEFRGEPIDEILVSRTMLECNIYIKELYMIIIYF